MESSRFTSDIAEREITDLSAQLKLLALNTAIQATVNKEGATNTRLRLVALKRLLQEVHILLSWHQGQDTRKAALEKALSNLAQRLNRAVADLDPQA